MIAAGVVFAVQAQAQAVIPDSLKAEQSLKAIAYGAQPEWQITGAVSSVKGDVLAKSFTSNVANTLYGRLPGLVVQQGTGEAAADFPILNARGVNTFGAGRNLFFVIDGIPSTEVFFQQLTPQEIESISLLKDASATAIYGGQAANGVLSVTTKRGYDSPLKVGFSAQYGLQHATRLPDFLGSYDYARLYNEALKNDGQPARYSTDDLAAYQNGSDPYGHPNVNWYKQLVRNVTPLANYNFHAKGGTDVVGYYVLFNAVNNSGLYKNTEKKSDFTKNDSYVRYNFRTNVDVKLAERLSMMVTLGGTVENKTNPGNEEFTGKTFALMASIPPNAFPVYTASNQPGGNALYSNPWADITETGYVSFNGRAAQTSAKLTGDLGMITPGLSISAAIGFNTYFKTYSEKKRTYARYSIDGTKYGDDTSLSGNEKNSYQWRNYVLQGFLNYDRVWGIHGMNAMLMASYDDYTQTNNFGGSNSSVLPYKNAGMGGRLTYTLDKRYIGEFSFGYTGNDNFAPGHRFGFFPAGSIGWLASNEAFLKDNEAINYLKIRGSYGLTGNTDIGGDRFSYGQYYGWGGYYFGDTNVSAGALEQSALANPDLTWEKEKKLNIGLDATLFKHVNLSFDYFKQNRYDILAKPFSTIPDFLGATLPFMNVGKVENKGFEAVVGYSSEPQKELTFFAEASAWFARNKILYAAEAPQLYDYLYEAGHRVDQYYLLEAIGFFQDNQDIANSPTQVFAAVQPGDIQFKNQNPEDDNVIDQNDFYPIGYSDMPELTLGFHAGLTYKGFDLDLMFQGAMNRSVYLGGRYGYAFIDNGQVSSMALNRWAYYPEEGIDTRATATYPRLSSMDNLNNYQSSSFWLKNGDFLKLRSLELGYAIPEKVAKRLKTENIRVFLNGTNLFSIDHLEGLTDPETISGGIGFPVLRTFSLGLSIQL